MGVQGEGGAKFIFSLWLEMVPTIMNTYFPVIKEITNIIRVIRFILNYKFLAQFKDIYSEEEGKKLIPFFNYDYKLILFSRNHREIKNKQKN